MQTVQTRRRFLSSAALAAAAGMLSLPQAEAAEPPPETLTVRFPKIPVICFAPQYVCEELLRIEGFTDIRYLDADGPTMSQDLGRGKFDFLATISMQAIVAIDGGAPIAILSGVHAGCYELFGREGIHGIADLKGKKVGLTATPELMQMMAAYVGLDPKRDLTLVSAPETKPLELFVEGKVDAYLALPPEPQ